MEPPLRPLLARRTGSVSKPSVLPANTFPTDGSPSPFAPSPSSSSRDNTLDGCSTPINVAGTAWDQPEDVVSQRTTRLQIELAECVETKTVTTTTTTKRSYPPLLVRPPRSLQSLDTKEFPLALKPTPYELTKFSYEVDGEVIHFHEDERSNSSPNGVRPVTKPRSKLSGARDFGNEHGYVTPTTTKTPKHLERVEDVTEESFGPKSARGPRSPDSMAKVSNTAQQRFGLQPHRRHHTSAYNHDAHERYSELHAALLSTPDPSDLEPIGHNVKFTSSSTTLTANDDTAPFEDPGSPITMATHAPFSSAVATPPIADTDLEPLELDSYEQRSAAPLVEPSTLRSSTTFATQNASLPSPSLSPTLAAANMHNALYSVTDDEDLEAVGTGSASATQSANSQESFHDLVGPRTLRSDMRFLEHRSGRPTAVRRHDPTVTNTSAMLDTFDSMPSEMKTFMMYQFLRRCPRKTLHVVADVVNPALKCDFLEELPAELSLQILGFLDHRDFCRAAQVSKRWRNIIDSNETGWKELFDRDEFILPAGELERAITEGWGWQDPYGSDGWERDLSVRPTSSDGEHSVAASSGKSFSTPSRPTTKRKRTLGSLGLDRTKRRALTSEAARSHDLKNQSAPIEKSKKSEGPSAAATAAALAVPNPQLGLPSLSKLHLFKSLYRRHYMLRRNWMSGKVQPRHMAFPAHPRHVITCLQFDDDKILTGSDDTFIHVYDTKTGALRKRLEGHEGGVWALQYEGNVLVSGSTDRSVRVWDIEKGLCTQVFHGHTSTVRCLQILMPVNTGKSLQGKAIMVPEKPLIITGSRDSQLRVWRLPEQGAKRYIQTGPPANDADCPYFIRVLMGHTHSVRAIAAHQDTLISGSYDNSVRVWKISTGETVHQLRGHGQKVYSVVLDHARKRCISGSMDNSVRIWSLETGNCLYTLEGHSSLVGLLDLQASRLVSAAADSTLRIWDPENGQCKNTLTAHTGAITCFQHDGTKVISGSDRTLKMWNVKTGECLQDLLTDLSGVWQVKFDERRCVAAVQRDALTYIEVLDFGASRDGVPRDERGFRRVLEGADVDRITDEDEVFH